MENARLTLDKYIDTVIQNISYSDTDPRLIAILGLVGEAGEVADLFKKKLRNKNLNDDVFKNNLILELGDTLYYLIATAHYFDISIIDIIDQHYIKLQSKIEELKNSYE